MHCQCSPSYRDYRRCALVSRSNSASARTASARSDWPCSEKGHPATTAIPGAPDGEPVMSAAAWTARTGDADFVAFMAQLLGDAFLAADHGETQTVAMAIAALRDQDDALASMPLDPDEGGADRQTAKRALIRECLTGLDVATGPDLDGFGAWLDALVASLHWIGLIS